MSVSRSLVKPALSRNNNGESHVVLRRDEPFAQLVAPDHKELDRGTLRAIIRQAGLTMEQFNELLG